jgi:hypothetical protein
LASYKERLYPSTPLPAFLGKDFPEVTEGVYYAREPVAFVSAPILQFFNNSIKLLYRNFQNINERYKLVVR